MSRARAAWIATLAAGALVVALVTAWPALRFDADLGGRAPIAFLAAKDADWYVAQVRHAADGTYGSANDLLHEAPVGDRRSPPWTVSLLAALHTALGADLRRFLVAASAVCAAGQFLLLAAIGRTAGLRRPLAAAAAAAGCLAPFLWSFHGGEWWFGHPERVTTGFLPLSRPVNPSVSGLLVWGGLLATLRWVRTPSRATWAAVAALLACQWTAYPAAFLATGALVSAAAVTLAAAGHGRRAAALAAAAAAGAVVNVLPIVEMLRGGDPADRSALESNLLALPTRAPILTANTLTAFALALLWLLLRRGRRALPQRAALVVGAPLAFLALFNVQVVTGRLDQPFHHDWFWSVPLLWIAAAAVAAEAGPRLRRASAALSRRLSHRAVPWAVAAVPVVVAALVAAGPAGAAVLRALGVIRAEEVQRPVAVVAAGVLAALGALWARRCVLRHRWRALGTPLCALSAVVAAREGAGLQEYEYLRRRTAFTEVQDLAPALRALRDHAPRDDVVACADDASARLVPAQTGLNVLISPDAQFAPWPADDEFRRRRLVNCALFGLGEDDLAAGLADDGPWHGAFFKWRRFGPLPRALAMVTNGVEPPPLPPGAAGDIVAAYRAIARRPRAELLRSYRVDWVLWRDAAASRGLRDPGASGGLEIVWTDRGVTLYRVPRG